MSVFFLSIENSWWQPPRDRVLTYHVGPYEKIDDFFVWNEKNECMLIFCFLRNLIKTKSYINSNNHLIVLYQILFRLWNGNSRWPRFLASDMGKMDKYLFPENFILIESKLNMNSHLLHKKISVDQKLKMATALMTNSNIGHYGKNKELFFFHRSYKHD